MTTINKTLKKSDGWVVVSVSGDVFVSNQGNYSVEYCWNNVDPAADFKPHTLYARNGVARDFETGALRMRNSSPMDEIIIAVDEP